MSFVYNFGFGVVVHQLSTNLLLSESCCVILGTLPWPIIINMSFGSSILDSYLSPRPWITKQIYPNILSLYFSLIYPHLAVFRFVNDFDLSDPLSIPVIDNLQGGLKIDGVEVFKTVRILHPRDSNYHEQMNDKEPTHPYCGNYVLHIKVNFFKIQFKYNLFKLRPKL